MKKKKFYSNKVGFVKGSIFFKYSDEVIKGEKPLEEITNQDIERVRVIKFKNQETVVVKNLETKEQYSMKTDELTSKYNKLEEELVVCLSTVKLGKSKDIIILGMRMGDKAPYFVARQNIKNFYNAMLKNQTVENDDFDWVGMSMRTDTCPEGFDFNAMLTVEEVLYSETIALYREDTLDTTLELISLFRFDEALLDNYNAHIQRNKKYLEEKELLPIIDGYCKDLRTFFVNNFVLDDIRKGMKVTTVEVDLSKYLETLENIDDPFSVSNEDMSVVQNEIIDRIGDYAMFLYNRNIDLSQIEMKYEILADKKDTLFLLLYNTKNDLKMGEIATDHNLTEEEKLNLAINLSISK